MKEKYRPLLRRLKILPGDRVLLVGDNHSQELRWQLEDALDDHVAVTHYRLHHNVHYPDYEGIGGADYFPPPLQSAMINHDVILCAATKAPAIHDHLRRKAQHLPDKTIGIYEDGLEFLARKPRDISASYVEDKVLFEEAGRTGTNG